MYLQWKSKLSEGEPQFAAIVFGSGLIGSSIISSLQNLNQQSNYLSKQFQVPWLDTSKQTAALELLHDDLENLFSSADRIEIIWSAGKAGFNSTQSEVNTELRNYSTIIQWVSQLQKRSGANITVSLISSLGGLFEQTELVDSTSSPRPTRPYGHLKLLQEYELLKHKNLENRIYRVSSAYGNISEQNRMGLIPTLIKNGLNQKNTALTGSLNTLRDYIWVNDLTDYLVKNINSNEYLNETQSIASFRTHSIQQIIDKVELLINKKLLITHSDCLTNTSSISICPSLKPQGISISEINQTMLTIIKHA